MEPLFSYRSAQIRGQLYCDESIVASDCVNSEGAIFISLHVTAFCKLRGSSERRRHMISERML